MHGNVSLWECAGTSGHVLSAQTCVLSPLCLHACDSSRECHSMPAAVSCLCACACVSEYTCVFAHTSVSLCPRVSHVLLPQGWPVCARVLGSLGTSDGFEALLFEGIFLLPLSPSSLIDMLLPCSLPKDHIQASSVWLESSVGSEKPSVAPPGTASSAGLQVSSRSCRQEPLRSC